MSHRCDKLIRLWVLLSLFLFFRVKSLSFEPSSTPLWDQKSSQYNSMTLFDCNGDGYPDVAINGAQNSPGPVLILVNKKRKAKFTEVNLSKIVGESFGGLSYGDFNNDGKIDLLTLMYVESSNQGKITVPVFLINGGDKNCKNWDAIPLNGTSHTTSAFAVLDVNHNGGTDVIMPSVSFWWLEDPTPIQSDTSLRISLNPHTMLGNTDPNNELGVNSNILDGVLAHDINGDGIVDVVVSVDDQPEKDNPTRIILGGKGNKNYEWVPTSEVSLPPLGRKKGSDWRFGDCDNDGFEDLFVSSSRVTNQKSMGIYHRSNVSIEYNRMSVSKLPPTPSTLSHGGDWGDFDLDGDSDLLVCYEGAPSMLYVNNGNCTFVSLEVHADIFISGICGFVDIDNDGDLDIVGGGLLFINTLNPRKKTGRYLFVQAQGRNDSNMLPFGTTVSVWFSNAPSLSLNNAEGHKQLSSGSNELHSPFYAHFGLLNIHGSVVDILVTFSSGRQYMRSKCDLDRSEALQVFNEGEIDPGNNRQEFCSPIILDLSGYANKVITPGVETALGDVANLNIDYTYGQRSKLAIHMTIAHITKPDLPFTVLTHVASIKSILKHIGLHRIEVQELEPITISLTLTDQHLGEPYYNLPKTFHGYQSHQNVTAITHIAVLGGPPISQFINSSNTDYVPSTFHYTYVGCFWKPDTLASVANSPDMTVELCRDSCSNVKYFSIQTNSKCYCFGEGHHDPKKMVPEDRCYRRCIDGLPCGSETSKHSVYLWERDATISPTREEIEDTPAWQMALMFAGALLMIIVMIISVMMLQKKRRHFSEFVGHRGEESDGSDFTATDAPNYSKLL